MAQRVSLNVNGLPVRKKTFLAKTVTFAPVPDYKFVINPILGQLDRVVNNLSILKIDADLTDPTGGGSAANGRIPIQLADGTIKYLAYYDSP